MLSSQNLMGRSALMSAALLWLLSASNVTATSVPLQNATSTFAQSSHGPANTIDNNADGSAWAISGGQGSDQTIVWEAVSNVVGPAGSDLKFDLDFTYLMSSTSAPQHTIKKFRLSVTGSGRGFFADGLANGGDVGGLDTTWTQLVPLTASATGGATLGINLGDNTITASGTNPNYAIYTVTTTSALTAITGFRLEAFVGPSDFGPFVGRSPGGNIALAEFDVDAVPIPEPSSAIVMLIGCFGLLLMRRKQGR